MHGWNGDGDDGEVGHAGLLRLGHGEVGACHINGVGGVREVGACSITSIGA